MDITVFESDFGCLKYDVTHESYVGSKVYLVIRVESLYNKLI